MMVEPRDGRSLNFELVQLLFVWRVDFFSLLLWSDWFVMLVVKLELFRRSY